MIQPRSSLRSFVRSVLGVTALGAFAAALPACSGNKGPSAKVNGQDTMNIQKSDFGKTDDGQAVELYTLTNDNGLVAKIATCRNHDQCHMIIRQSLR